MAQKELTDIFARFYSFEELLNIVYTYEYEHNCVFARRHSQSSVNANKTRKYKIPDEIMYVRIHFWCCHAKNDKTLERASTKSKGMRKKGYLSTDCKANFIAIYDPLSKGLRIKTQEAIWTHFGHPTTRESYAKSLKIRRLLEKDMTPNEKRRKRYLEKKQELLTKEELEKMVVEDNVLDIDMQNTELEQKPSPEDADLAAVRQMIDGPGSLRTPVILNLDKEFIVTARVADAIEIKTEPIEMVESACASDGSFDERNPVMCYELAVNHHDYSLPGSAEGKSIFVDERVADSLYSVRKNTQLNASHKPKSQNVDAQGLKLPLTAANKFKHFANFVSSTLEGLDTKKANEKMRQIFDILEND